MPKIIAFSGKRGVGKTTAALHLVEKYGFKRVSFADRLKEIGCMLFPFKNQDLSTKGKEKPFSVYDWTPRDFLISLGQFMRYFDPDYWVKASNLDKLEGRVVIDDLRFPNEAEYIKSLGGIIIRIERYENLNIYGKNLDDPSETSMDNYKYDHKIDDCRNVSMDDLTSSLDDLAKQLGIRRW